MRRITGVILIFLAGIMWQQEDVTYGLIPGTKGEYAAVAALGGAGAGMAHWALCGAVGVATGGSAFGVALVGQALVGAVAGALTGAAAGSSPSYVAFRRPTYSPWLCLLVLMAGVLCYSWKRKKPLASV